MSRMTQPGPDPASLPEAIPVLSYERQTDDGAMDWVVRFIGAWVICRGAGSVLPYLVQAFRSASITGFLSPSTRWATPLLGGLASILFGTAIVRRQRYGFHGSLVLLAVVPVIGMAPTLFTNSAAVSLINIPSAALPPGTLFAVLLSILRRADAKGVLQPVRVDRIGVPPEGSNVGFLISRMGWVYLVHGGMTIVHLGMWPLLMRVGVSMPHWDWQISVQVAMEVAVGMCGLLLCQRKAWALWLLAAILPLQAIGGPLLVMWSYYFPSGFAFTTRAAMLIPSVAGTTASVFMLCLLARKATRTAA